MVVQRSDRSDDTAHIIVAAELDNAAPVANWLLPMIQAVDNHLGELPELGLADAGYRSEENLSKAAIEYPSGQVILK